MLMLLLLLWPWLVISAERSSEPDCSTQSSQWCGTAESDVDGPGPRYGGGHHGCARVPVNNNIELHPLFRDSKHRLFMNTNSHTSRS